MEKERSRMDEEVWLRPNGCADVVERFHTLCAAAMHEPQHHFTLSEFGEGSAHEILKLPTRWQVRFEFEWGDMLGSFDGSGALEESSAALVPTEYVVENVPQL
jgi:hypothetical protein